MAKLIVVNKADTNRLDDSKKFFYLKLYTGTLNLASLIISLFNDTKSFFNYRSEDSGTVKPSIKLSINMNLTF